MKKKKLLAGSIFLLLLNCLAYTQPTPVDNGCQHEVEGSCPTGIEGGIELIRNGDFDEYSMLPFQHSQLHFANNWIQLPNSPSTADYVHKKVDCSEPGVPTIPCVNGAELRGNNTYFQEGQNAVCKQKPKSGKGFGLIRALVTDLGDNTCSFSELGAEYMVQELGSPLVAGTQYTAKMFVTSVERSVFGCSGLSMLFTEDLPQTEEVVCPLRGYTPQVTSEAVIRETEDWVEISGTFIATGGEKYLTIGVIDPDASDLVDLNRGLTLNDLPINAAFYAVDEVSLVYDVCNQPGYNNNEPIYVNDMLASEIDHTDLPNWAIINESVPYYKIENATGFQYRIKDRWGEFIYFLEGADPCGMDSLQFIWNGIVNNLSNVDCDTWVGLGNDPVFTYFLEVWNCKESHILSGNISVLGAEGEGDEFGQPFPYDCSCPNFSNLICNSGLVIHGEQITEASTKEASTVIVADASEVNSNGSEVVFRAGFQIDLYEGFEVSAGSDFHCYIGDCEGEGNLSGGDQINFKKRNASAPSNSKGTTFQDRFVANTFDRSEKTYRPNQIQVYPNPTSNWVDLQFSSSENSEIELFLVNFKGEIIQHLPKVQSTKGLNTIRLNLEDQPDGMYYCRLVLDGETVLHSAKFIKILP